ncbi:hypothetical protein KFU94_66135 [Chloroflexi bacterium TSY]|nr:hypothetical protein [Chloroflexi bacterium TSY]
MDKQNVREPMPRHIAMVHCALVRKENQAQWWSFGHWQCWTCMKFGQGEPRKMLMSRTPGFRGCPLVNQRYDAELRAKQLSSRR